MAIRVVDILQLDVLKWAHTLAGVRGINREIQYIDVLETPDFENLVKPNVLLLTTGYAIQDDEELQKNIINRMHEVNAAGIAVQLSKYFNLVPPAMVELANELQIPIIELPAQAVFSDIISESLRLIFSHQGAMLRRSQEIHHRLAEVVLAGGDLTNIAQKLADLVRNTVIVTDRDFRLMAYAYWTEGLNNSKRRRVYQGKTLDQFLDNLEKTGFIDKIRKEKKANRVEAFFSKQGEQAWVVVPVLISHEIWGYIAVLEDYNRMRELELGALQQACAVIAMSIFKQRSYEEIERRRRNDFIFSLLEEQTWDESFLTKARSFSLPVGQQYAVMKFEISNFDAYYNPRYQENTDAHRFDVKRKLLGMIATQLSSRHKILIVAYKGDILTVICPIKQFCTGDIKFRASTAELRQEVNAYIEGLEVVVGVSRICEDFKAMPLANQEAKEALAIGRLVFGGKGIYHFDDLGTYQLLFRLGGQPETKKFYQNTFGALDNLDQKTRDEMIKTLEAYFLANENIHKAAEFLYMHRNSLKYRLEKISELLSINLGDAEACFRLQLALRLRHLL